MATGVRFTARAVPYWHDPGTTNHVQIQGTGRAVVVTKLSHSMHKSSVIRTTTRGSSVGAQERCACCTVGAHRQRERGQAHRAAQLSTGNARYSCLVFHEEKRFAAPPRLSYDPATRA